MIEQLFSLVRRLSRLYPSLVAILLGWFFAHMSFAIPARKLYEAESLVAFRHPNPTYPTHILIVAKKPVANFESLSQADQDFFTDLVTCVQTLVKSFHLDDTGYRLIVNGGPFQDIPHLHFHLISEAPFT